MKRLVVAVSVVLVLALSSSSVFAQSWKDRREAQKLGVQARSLVKRGDFKEAAKKYKKADDLYPSPHYKVEVAKLLVELEDFVQAGKVLKAAAESKPRQWAERKAIKDAQRLMTEVEERTPSISVSVIKPKSSGAEITIAGDSYDSAEGAIPYNPGEYEVVVSLDGYETWTKKVTLRESDRKELDVKMRGGGPAPDEDADSGGGFSPIPAYISWGVGVVGLGLGTGFGIAAIQSTNNVLASDLCDGTSCQPDAEDDITTALVQGNVSTAGFVIGGVGVAAGTVLFIIAASSDDDAPEEGDEDGALSIEAKPLLGPGYVGVYGTF